MSIEAGWYHAEGDPPNTVRYWDGAQWQGGPQAPPVQPGPLSQQPQPFTAESAGSGFDPFAPTPADEVTEPQTPPPSWSQTPAQTSSPATSLSGHQTQPGWYPADGDPPNTIRYWDGSQWQGGPRPAGGFGAGGREQLSPLQYVSRAYTSRFADFSGRARRAEFGWFILIFWIAFFVLTVLTDNSDGESLIAGLFWLASLLPYFALSVRRLHDMNLSGWVMLALFIPIVNLILFLVMLFSDSQAAPNKWGRSPKYG